MLLTTTYFGFVLDTQYNCLHYLILLMTTDIDSMLDTCVPSILLILFESDVQVHVPYSVEVSFVHLYRIRP